MYPGIGYVMNWEEIDRCIDNTSNNFRSYQDYVDEINWPDNLVFNTLLCHVFQTMENGHLFAHMPS